MWDNLRQGADTDQDGQVNDNILTVRINVSFLMQILPIKKVLEQRTKRGSVRIRTDNNAVFVFFRWVERSGSNCGKNTRKIHRTHPNGKKRTCLWRSSCSMHPVSLLCFQFPRKREENNWSALLSKSLEDPLNIYKRIRNFQNIRNFFPIFSYIFVQHFLIFCSIFFFLSFFYIIIISSIISNQRFD